MNEKRKDNLYGLKAEKVFSAFGSNEKGLTEAKAKAAYKKYGPNIIEGKKQSSLFRLFIDQLNNPIIFLLAGATAVSFFFDDIPEAIAIIVVIILNTAIGFWMEYQARTSIKALKKLNRLKTRVIRNNEPRKVDASKIVPGDVIELEAGDVIPADARIFFASDLKVDESSLTGESLPVDKNSKTIDEDVDLAERTNMLFKGTAVTNGKARAMVTATGKQTEIGIAMGRKGTQIAREVADMVLKDDTFSSIVHAIEERRIIFENIRKFIVYQLSYHFAEILIIAGISFSLFNLPLLALQLLFLNLVSDVFPALALGLGKGDSHIMKRRPKDPKEPIINKKNWLAMGIYGSIMAVKISGVYLLVIFHFNESKEIANTVTFFSLAVVQLLHVFNMRDPHEPVFINQVVKNRYIWMALAFCFLLLAAAYFVPFLYDALSFEKLSAGYWLLIGAASIFTLIIIQTVKNIFKI